jgi:hypothetical protein
MIKYVLFVAVTTVLAVALTGCGDSPGAQKSTELKKESAPATSAALPAGLLLSEAPGGAKDVSATKKEAKEGDEVVIRGQVGGREEVFTAGRAAFLIADMKLPACSKRKGDKCATPWDFCCETPETRTANTATIQIVDDQGKVLKSDVRGASGIDHLSVLVIKGKVAKREEQNLVINATGIFVETAQPKAN